MEYTLESLYILLVLRGTESLYWVKNQKGKNVIYFVEPEHPSGSQGYRVTVLS